MPIVLSVRNSLNKEQSCLYSAAVKKKHLEREVTAEGWEAKTKTRS